MSSIAAIDLTQEDSDNAEDFHETNDFEESKHSNGSADVSSMEPVVSETPEQKNDEQEANERPYDRPNGVIPFGSSRLEESKARSSISEEQQPQKQQRQGQKLLLPLIRGSRKWNQSFDGVQSPEVPDAISSGSSIESLFKRQKLDVDEPQIRPENINEDTTEKTGYVSPLSLTSRESSPTYKRRSTGELSKGDGLANDNGLNGGVPSQEMALLANNKDELGPQFLPPSASDNAFNENQAPIIVLSDEEDEPSSVSKNRTQGIVQVPSSANGLAAANDNVTKLRAVHEKNLKVKVLGDEEFARLKNTCRDTRIILQRKLQKRERLILETKGLLESASSAEETALIEKDIRYIEGRRSQTLLKLHQLDNKETQAAERYGRFLNGHGSKLRQSQLDLQNALSSRINSNMVEKRAKLMDERSNIDRLHRNGAINGHTMIQRKAAIDKMLNELQSTQRVPEASATAQSSDIYFRSIEIAMNLIQKNTVRSVENKNLMTHYLNVVARFKRTSDRGERFGASTKHQVERAITELIRHGVKMPAVVDYLRKLNFIVSPEELHRKYFSHGTDKGGDDFLSVDNKADNDNDILELVKHQDEQRSTNSFQLSSIYNSQDNDSLQKLLEGLKTTEAEIEGEELTPPELTVNLMKHQRQGLHWLLQVEKSSKKGGLLADDMGLGKTVQAIALMIANRSSDENCKTNVIVAPVAVLRVWEAEVRTKVNKNTKLKVLIFGGSGGAKVQTYRSLLRYDVVLVSYQTLASELKKHWPARLTQESEEPTVVDVPDIKAINSLKERNEYWSPFFCDQSIFYRIILDEAQNIKNKKTQSSKACCALFSTYRWALSGTPVQNNIMELYSLIRFLRISPYNREQRFRMDIGNPLGRVSNDYDSHDRKQATKKVQVLLRAVMLRRTKDSQIDGKPILELPEKIINNEEQTLEGEELTFYTDLEQKNQKKAEKLMNNRSKGNYSSILTLLLRLRQACCHSELVIMGEHKSETSKVANGKNFENDWLRLFELARRMPGIGKSAVIEGLENMTCPYCMEQMELDSAVVITPCGHMLCDGCADQYFEDIRSQGNTRKIVNSGYAVPCLVCNRIVDDNAVVTYKLYDQAVNQNLSVQGLKEEYEVEMRAQRDRLKKGYQVKLDSLQPSVKILQCLDIVRKVLDSSEQEKVIVFSQFTTFFDILQHFIRKELGIPHLRYDGSMNAQARASTIEEFYKNPNRRILLISMKAGNSGLTLTCANHVILVDPFWNPFVEEQAMDRCYRISQTRAVQVHKLLVKNSVEDRILELQRKKRELVESAMSPDKIQEVNSLGRRELGFLFGLNTL
ncbi:LAFA_0C04808g1_1 [Lachancea sp. 'fantastica']|nr:LAFA_0C04808g1_1 [Lachancea sp. 'fantastica']